MYSWLQYVDNREAPSWVISFYEMLFLAQSIWAEMYTRTINAVCLFKVT